MIAAVPASPATPIEAWVGAGPTASGATSPAPSSPSAECIVGTTFSGDLPTLPDVIGAQMARFRISFYIFVGKVGNSVRENRVGNAAINITYAQQRQWYTAPIPMFENGCVAHSQASNSKSNFDLTRQVFDLDV